MELNYQTERKIKELKEKIKRKESIKKDKRFNDWLEKYKDYFNDKQLIYLGYEEKIEVIEKTLEKEIDFSEKKFELTNIKNITLEQRKEFLLSDDFFEMIFNYFSSVKRKGDFEIPQKYLKMSDVKLISCRASEELYKNIVKIAKENGFSITAMLNYIFGDFIEKYQK